MLRKMIQVVEDDKDLREYLTELLNDSGFSVMANEKGIPAIRLAENKEPDLMILDLSLPDISGEEVCSKVKDINPDLPIIILTGKDTTDDIVKGLNLGADDYMTKPFSGEELLARVKARLRESKEGTQLKVADLVLDTDTVSVKRGDKGIELTPQEFKLLHFLMENKNRVMSRDVILSRLWDAGSDIETRVVDVYIGYLRKKVDSDFDKPLIHSVRGFGYVLKED